MGKTHRRQEAMTAWEQSQAAIRGAERRQLESIERDTTLLGYLGSDEQVAGTGRFADIDPRAAGYAQNYTLDPDLAQTTELNPFSRITVSDLQGVESQANLMLDQAEALARSGDYAGADLLRDQAADLVSGGGGLKRWPRNTSELYQLGSDPAARAQIEASSPTAKLVGRQLQEARGIMDRGQAYDDLYGRLTEPALEELAAGRDLGELQIAQGFRAGQSELTRFGAERGAGRDPYAEQAMRAGVQRAGAAELAATNLQYRQEAAGVKARASAALEEYRAGVATNAVGLALDFVKGRPSSSVSPAQTALNSLSTFTAAELERIGTLHWGRFLSAEAKEDARDAMYARLAMVAGGLVLGVVGGVFAAPFLGITAAAGASLGGSLGVQAGNAASGGGGGGGGGAPNYFSPSATTARTPDFNPNTNTRREPNLAPDLSLEA